MVMEMVLVLKRSRLGPEFRRPASRTGRRDLRPQECVHAGHTIKNGAPEGAPRKHPPLGEGKEEKPRRMARQPTVGVAPMPAVYAD